MYTFLCHSGSYRAGGAITESWQGVVYCCCSNRRLSRKSLTAEKGEGLALQYPPLIADTFNTRDELWALRLEGRGGFGLSGWLDAVHFCQSHRSRNWVEPTFNRGPDFYAGTTGTHTHIGGKGSGNIWYALLNFELEMIEQQCRLIYIGAGPECKSTPNRLEYDGSCRRAYCHGV